METTLGSEWTHPGQMFSSGPVSYERHRRQRGNVGSLPGVTSSLRLGRRSPNLRCIILRALLLSACILLATGNICFALSRKAATQADEIKQAKLVSLARRAGLNQLTDCEKKVVYAAAVGDDADCGGKKVPAPSEGFWQSYDEVQNGPPKDATNKQLSDLREHRNKLEASLNKWLGQPQPYDLNVHLVRWLSTDPEAVKLVDPRGIQVDGARVVDDARVVDGAHLTHSLDLSFAEVKFPLVFEHSLFQGRIKFIGARPAKLDLGGSRLLKGIFAYSVTVSTIINLSGVTSQDKVAIANGKLGSDLICSGGIFYKQEGAASDLKEPKPSSRTPKPKRASQNETASRLTNSTNGKAKNRKAVQDQEQNDEETVLDARDLKARNVKLNRGFSATGMVDLSGAELSDSLDCRGGIFSNPEGTALNAEDLKAGDVKLSGGFSATGMVNLSGADLSGNLDCRGGIFTNPSGSTRSMVYAALGSSTGPLNEPPIETIEAPDETNINGDQIRPNSPSGVALDPKSGRIYVADGGDLQVSPPILSSVLVYKARSSSNEAPFATIRGDKTGLNCAADVAVDDKGLIYVADEGVGCIGTGSVLVYKALGNRTKTINEAPIATIRGDKTSLHAPEGIVLDAKNRIYVADEGDDGNPSVLVYKAESNGNEAPIATIRGDKTSLHAPEGIVLDAKNRIYVADDDDPSVLVYKAGSNGNEAPIATIRGDKTGLHAPAGIALDAKNRIYVADEGNTSPALAAVELKARDVFLGDTTEKLIAKGMVDLSNASVSGVLYDTPASWGNWDPRYNKFKYGSGSDTSYTLDGFVYGDFVGPWTVHDRVKWLEGQSPFATQPYEQLAKVLHDNGHDSDSRQVLIAMERDMWLREAKQQDTPPWGWIRGPLTSMWSAILHWTIGYGYNTWYAVLFSAILLLFGSSYFSYANRYHESRWIISTEHSEETYKPFSGFVYALETLLPFVDLYQAKHWVPNARSRGGRILRRYLWVHTLLGWYFASMILAGLSGIVQK
jgi:DNA-binding beta-propeller fold protein YncE